MKLDKIKFARLISFIQRTASTVLTNSEIEDIDNMIDIELPEQQVVRASIEGIHELMALMSDGKKKIDAIRVHRSLTGYPFKDSMRIIDSCWHPASDEAKV